MDHVDPVGAAINLATTRQNENITHSFVLQSLHAFNAWVKPTKHAVLHSFSKETQHFGSCLSFGEECIQVNLGLYIIATMLIVTIV